MLRAFCTRSQRSERNIPLRIDNCKKQPSCMEDIRAEDTVMSEGNPPLIPQDDDSPPSRSRKALRYWLGEMW